MEIKITIDKRTELLGIILLISDYTKIYPDCVAEEISNKEYRDKILKRFLKYKDEKAVKLFNKIINELNFGYDAPISLFLQLNEDFSYNQLDEYPFVTRLNNSPLVLEFLDELPKFVEKIKFEKYFKDNEGFYNKIIGNENKKVDTSGVLDFLKRFYKIDMSDKNFIVNLMPFSTRSDYGATTNNGKNVYCNRSIKRKTLAFFDGNVTDGMLLRHEFGHSFINPLTLKYLNIPETCLKEIMELTGYWGPANIISETVNRAIEPIYLKYEYKDEEESKKRIEKDKKFGFKDIETYIKILEKYYINIDKYRDFEEFYPMLMNELKKFYIVNYNPIK